MPRSVRSGRCVYAPLLTRLLCSTSQGSKGWIDPTRTFD